MSDFKVRMATSADAAEMIEIYRPSIVNSPISFEFDVPSLANFQERILETLVKFPWLVCEQDGRMAGYAYAGPYRSRCAYSWSVESTVYVDSEFQGKGIGKKLYRRLFEILKGQGVVNVIAGIT